MKTIALFSESSLLEFLEKRRTSMRREVHDEPENKLLNVNEDEYIAYLVARYSVPNLIVDTGDLTMSQGETDIPAEQFPSSFYVRSGEKYSRPTLKVYVPFSGEEEILTLQPSTHLLWRETVNVHNGSLSFEVIDWGNGADEIKRRINSTVSKIQQQANHVQDDISQFNTRLTTDATHEVQTCKAEHLRRLNLVEQLGIPIRINENVPSTFSVPVLKKVTIVKPASSSEPYKADPALDQSVYEEILRICHESGVEMERHPSIYDGTGEETLRDHFLMVLSPHFNSASGETFNKSGKTNILIRHENKNVFVAECKYWRGSTQFSKDIGQALSYLTWRDSKAAIICFIPNKELDPILAKVDSVVREHDCFRGFRGKRNQSWFDYDFVLPADKTRGVKLAVLCFHFPPKQHSQRDQESLRDDLPQSRQ